jgi:hypothetical protein
MQLIHPGTPVVAVHCSACALACNAPKVPAAETTSALSLEQCPAGLAKQGKRQHLKEALQVAEERPH